MTLSLTLLLIALLLQLVAGQTTLEDLQASALPVFDCLSQGQHQPLVEPDIISSQDDDVFEFNLTIDAGMVGDKLPCGIRFQSRLYHGTFPGPTIVTRRGQTINLQLINNLEPELNTVPIVKNFFHTPNTTNLHIHFIHASPGNNPEDDVPQDNVLSVVVPPGATQDYSFRPIHPQHAAGTGFYHPHYHGSVYFQMYNGMAGAWIMQDEPDREYAQAPELAQMTEHVLLMQEISMGNHEDIMSMDNAKTGNPTFQFWKKGGGPHSNMPLNLENPNNVDIRLLLTNGQYNPKVGIAKGELKRLRLINAITTDSLHFLLDHPTACQMWELAKDSMYLPEPRLVDSVFVAAGSRVDVAVQCHGEELQVGDLVQVVSDHTGYPGDRFTVNGPSGVEGTFRMGYVWSSLSFNMAHPDNRNQAFLTLEIVQDESKADMQLPNVLPAHADYTQLLVDTSAATETLPKESIKEFVFAGPADIYNDPDGYFNGTVTMKFRDVNKRMFDESVVLWNETLGELDEWHLYNIDDPGSDSINAALFSHHFHFHTNHYLMMHDDYETGGLLFRQGELRDTIPFYPTKFGNVSRDPVRIRVLPLDYTGTNIVHCHQADHSDQGMAALFGMDLPVDETASDAGEATPDSAANGETSTSASTASSLSSRLIAVFLAIIFY